MARPNMCPTAFFKLLHLPGLYPQTLEHPESRRRYEPITELLWELNWRLRCVINSSLFIKECDTTIICLFIAVSGAGKLVPPSCFAAGFPVAPKPLFCKYGGGEATHFPIIVGFFWFLPILSVVLPYLTRICLLCLWNLPIVSVDTSGVAT